MVERHILVFTLENEEASRSIPELLSDLSIAPDDLFYFEHVTSVDDAVALLQKTSYTVILLGLPIGQTIGSGLDLVVQLRHIRPEVPIITFVTQETIGLGLQALEFGAYSYVSTQSVTPPILRKLIDKAAAQKRLLQEAYDQGNLDQSLFALLPVRVAILNETGHVTAVNQEWQSQAKNTSDPLIVKTEIGADFLRLCERVNKPDLAVIVRKILDGKQMKYAHEYPWKQDKQIVWWMISIIALGHPRGGAIVAIREVTETVTSQIRLSSYETEVSDLKRGVITLVHDLRTPIATMRLYLHLLKNDSSTKKEYYLTVLDQTTVHMEQFVGDLLAFSTLEHTEETKLFRPTNIGDLVEHVVELQQPLAVTKGLYLGCEVKQDILLVQGDPRQLTRVVTNLVSNAIRYTEVGGIHVTIERDDASKRILLTVGDSGIGIGPEAMPHIFEPFFRSERAQALTDAGTGLGLSIVQRIVAFHSGHIEVISEPNLGSTFRVFLPAVDVGDNPLLEEHLL